MGIKFGFELKQIRHKKGVRQKKTYKERNGEEIWKDIEYDRESNKISWYIREKDKNLFCEESV